jgi:hypothetical protein
LLPLAKQAHQVREFEWEVAGIIAAAPEELPYHKESLRHRQHDLAAARRILYQSFRKCLRAGIERWKIKLACV